ncbi:MAG: hypothetical protein K1X65_10375 [Caldilineales bacterium]|nr:hypothetical protein [Caldilineales bacterium]MCW5861303.1 hypothetical protein [Caldilineales bacterium]
MTTATQVDRLDVYTLKRPFNDQNQMCVRLETIDSVALHRQWQAGLDRERFFDQVFREKDEYEYRTE